jgi:phosphohistidine phosphatase
MFLYLVQHAEARREEEDPARDLTPKGRREVARVAQMAGKMDLRVSRIYHSGKTRALATAAILGDALKPPHGLAAADGLAPLDDPEIWAGRLANLAEDLLLVGHLPHLSRLASLLLGGDQEKGILNFKMGGMVCLHQAAGGSWGVEWMLIPEIIG